MSPLQYCFLLRIKCKTVLYIFVTNTYMVFKHIKYQAQNKKATTQESLVYLVKLITNVT